VPIFRQGRMWFPKTMPFVTTTGEAQDAVKFLRDHEYLQYPNTMHKDGLDAMSRIVEPDLPDPWPYREIKRKSTDAWRGELMKTERKPGLTWMSG